MTEHDLQAFGITRPVLLVGTLTALSSCQTPPVVFLLDENHGSDECIEQNVANAKALVEKANVSVVGVESHQGGIEWDDYKGCYYGDRFHPGTDPQPVNNCSKFADRLRASGAPVFGVECLGMLNQQECDFVPGGPWHNKAAREHPFNARRSQHFLQTLVELWRRSGGEGNMILNAGGDHISHIANWVRAGTADNITGQRATYIHIRVPAYKAA